jgi:hypothetical protein
VDLIAAIEEGIPPRQYLPGAEEVIPKGKRIHVAAEKKVGKSLVFATVLPVEVIAAGGRVVVLDRENGDDESARRLETVLDAREADARFCETVRERLHYHAWPQLRLEWASDPDYPQAFGEADVVVFDSSRSHTASLALRENESDDYSRFVAALIDPLMRAGKAVIVLDNTGHSEKERARGTTAKEDLCDIAFTVRTIKPFSLQQAGIVELRCMYSRIGEITHGDSWRMELGDGAYGSWQRDERPAEDSSAFRPTHQMRAVSETVEQSPGLSKAAIRSAVKGKNEYIDRALELLISEGYIEVYKDGRAHRHRSLRPYRGDPENDNAPQHASMRPECASGVVERNAPTRPSPKEGAGRGATPGLDGSGERAPRLDALDSADGSASANDGDTPLEPGLDSASDEGLGELAEQVLRRQEGRR